MFYSQSLPGAFKDLIGGMSAGVFILIAAGIMLIITEFYQSARKVLGILGAALIVAGLGVRVLAGADALIIFLLVFFIVTILFAAHAVILFMQKGGWLAHAQGLLAAKNAPGGGRLGYLKNMTGIAVSDIDGTGNISINEVNFTVLSDEKIEKGSFVRVIKVDGDEISVELFDPEEQL